MVLPVVGNYTQKATPIFIEYSSWHMKERTTKFLSNYPLQVSHAEWDVNKFVALQQSRIAELEEGARVESQRRETEVAEISNRSDLELEKINWFIFRRKYPVTRPQFFLVFPSFSHPFFPRRATVAESQLSEREGVLSRLKAAHHTERQSWESARARLCADLEKVKLEGKCNSVKSEELLTEARNTIEQ